MRAVARAMRRAGLRNVQELQIVFNRTKLQRNLNNIGVRSFILTGVARGTQNPVLAVRGRVPATAAQLKPLAVRAAV